MLERIANISTLRSFTRLSNFVGRQQNIYTFQSCLNKPYGQVHSKHLISASIKSANLSSLSPSLTKLTKIPGKNLILKRWSTHDHVNLWKFERIVSALFIPVLPLCFMVDNAIFDSLLAVLSVVHVHWGLEAIIVDYARPIVVGPLVPKICFFLLYLTSAVTLAGLLVLAINGPGISKVIKQGWAIGHEKPIEDKKKK